MIRGVRPVAGVLLMTSIMALLRPALLVSAMFVMLLTVMAVTMAQIVMPLTLTPLIVMILLVLASFGLTMFAVLLLCSGDLRQRSEHERHHDRTQARYRAHERCPP
jgi:hypothetical protein